MRFNFHAVFQNQSPQPLGVQHSWGSVWSSLAPSWSPSPPRASGPMPPGPPRLPPPHWTGPARQKLNSEFPASFVIFVPGNNSTEGLWAGRWPRRHETWWRRKSVWGWWNWRFLSLKNICVIQKYVSHNIIRIKILLTGPSKCVEGLGDSDPLVQDIVLHQVSSKQFLHNSWCKRGLQVQWS